MHRTWPKHEPQVATLRTLLQAALLPVSHPASCLQLGPSSALAHEVVDVQDMAVDQAAHSGRGRRSVERRRAFRATLRFGSYRRRLQDGSVSGPCQFLHQVDLFCHIERSEESDSQNQVAEEAAREADIAVEGGTWICWCP